jgi:hypothetical protein
MDRLWPTTFSFCCHILAAGSHDQNIEVCSSSGDDDGAMGQYTKLEWDE